jgi:hypothetical protein
MSIVKYLSLCILFTSCSVFYKNTPLKNTKWELISIHDSTSGKTAVFPKDNPLFFTFKNSTVKIFHFWRFKDIITNYDGWLIMETDTQRNKKFQESDWFKYDISTKFKDTIQLEWRNVLYAPEKGYGESLKRYNSELFDALFEMTTGVGSYEIKDSKLIINIGYSFRHYRLEPVKLACILQKVVS